MNEMKWMKWNTSSTDRVPRMARKCPSSVCRIVSCTSCDDLPKNCSLAVCSSSLAVIILHCATPVTCARQLIKLVNSISVFLNRLTLGRLTVSGTPCAVSTCSQTGFSVITWIFKKSSSYHTFMIHKQKYVSIHLQRVGNIRWTNGRSPLIKRCPWKI